MAREINRNKIFVVETSKIAVIDTAYTNTAVGKQWYNDYVAHLPEKFKQLIKSSQSSLSCKFGDLQSVKKFALPSSIARIGIIVLQILKLLKRKKIPLLLSKTLFKKVKTVNGKQNKKVTTKKCYLKNKLI